MEEKSFFAHQNLNHRYRGTDVEIIHHILSGEAFHIITGDNFGKYVFQRNQLRQYAYSPAGTYTEPSKLAASSLITAIMRHQISLQATALVGSAKSFNTHAVPFLDALIDSGGFQLKTAGGLENIRLEMVFNGASISRAELRKMTPEMESGRISGMKFSEVSISASEFLHSLKYSGIIFNPEQSIAFQEALKQDGRKIAQHTSLALSFLKK
ncbi:MAG: hypothetical protein PHX61_08335 [Alphaproteobacteria bacterium]|nr:hypothetical protein [Alphaproteobacteria bacterium]